jgi:hypothetical protein
MGKLHQEDVRAKIQASQLINVLQDHALNGESEISQSRMKAIEILLRKSVPDLSAVTVSGDADNPIEHTHRLSAEAQRLMGELVPGRANTSGEAPVQDGPVLSAEVGAEPEGRGAPVDL